MRIYPSFTVAIDHVLRELLLSSYTVKGNRWQSVDVSDKPEMQTREVFNTSFSVALYGEDLEEYRIDIQPNLPWADDHFLERVGGQPLNPGETWKSWPWAQSADKFRKSRDGCFSHSYMERYWPHFGGIPGGKAPRGTADSDINALRYPLSGIRYKYGDLQDVVEHLYQDCDSRQAYLPIFFPEDTGVVHGERVPCTLGYHFFHRHGFLHLTYYIRSCDFVRHFRDDLYLSLRLQLWMLDRLREMEKAKKPDPQACSYNRQLFWDQVKPGQFVFHCVSLHCFENDYKNLCDENHVQG